MDVFEYNNSISKEKCHFIAANGFPPQAYNHIFKPISSCSIQSPLLKPLWKSKPAAILDSWMDFADDLVPYVDKFKPKIVAGHSIGAVIWLLYAIKHNYSFDKVIMIDPALFPKWVYRTYRLVHSVGLQSHFHPMIKLTLNRKTEFDSLEEIQENYSQKKIFSRIKKEVLNDYIHSVFKKTKNGFLLDYSPEWESIIYEKGMLEDRVIWDYMARLSITTEIIYLKGELSNICTDSITRRLASLCSHFYSYEIADTTHLLPFEKPENVSEIINLHLEK
tara:strand:+ start:3729 stop:4559 length:831 start_codon:yes stop_codon:yes gene_type:complete